MELSTGGVEAALFGLGDTGPDERAAVVFDEAQQQRSGTEPGDFGIVIAEPDEFTAETPEMIAVSAQGLVGQPLRKQIDQEGSEALDEGLSDGEIGIVETPRPGPVRKVRSIGRQSRSRVGCDNGGFTRGSALERHAAHPIAQCLSSFSRLRL